MTDEIKHAHYFKEWHGEIDVYRVLKLFEVHDPAIQHAIKKLLFAGLRGVKDKTKDYEEARDSINRALEMLLEEH